MNQNLSAKIDNSLKKVEGLNFISLTTILFITLYKRPSFDE